MIYFINLMQRSVVAVNALKAKAAEHQQTIVSTNFAPDGIVIALRGEAMYKQRFLDAIGAYEVHPNEMYRKLYP